MFNQPQNTRKRTPHHEKKPSDRSSAVLNPLQQRPMPSSGDILHLQRTIGNRATLQFLQASVVRLLPERQLQRKLSDAKQFRKLAKEDDTLLTISQAADDYNKIADKRETAEEFQTCFERLQAVERAIYEWFDNVSQDQQELKNHASSADVRAFLDDVEQEHQGLVSQSKHLVDVLPFDTSALDEDEIAEMKKLWQEIAHNQGKIKLIGSDTYNERVLSELGHILSTPTGRTLLTVLNAPPTSRRPFFRSSDLTNIYIGEFKSQLPKKVLKASPSLEDMDHSEAQPLNINENKRKRRQVATTEVRKRLIGNGPAPDKNDYPSATEDSLINVRDAAWSGKKGFTNQNTRYDFNKRRAGAFVTSFPGEATIPAKDTDHEILTPGWVTLGHELGHAANMRTGATTIESKVAINGELLNDLAGGIEEGKKWDNAEELLNIENVENPLRREAGLTERGSHQAPTWMINRVMALKEVWKKQLTKVIAVPSPYQKSGSPENRNWDRVYKLALATPAKELCDPVRVEQVDTEVAQIWEPLVEELGERTQVRLSDE